MDRPWLADTELPPRAAAEILAAQFPELAPVSLELFARGWDNIAYLVNDTWVFRFPRREIAVALIHTEAAVLPAIAPRLPLPIPVPSMVGVPSEVFPRPFLGYARLPGTDAARAEVVDTEALAEPLGRFLAALHAIPAGEASLLGAGPDTLGRLDVAKRAPRLLERLEAAVEAGLIADPAPLARLCAETPRDYAPVARCLVHGDLHPANVLVDASGGPAGVIDWGDVHIGDPAVDLGIAELLLSPSAQARFRAAYGPIPDDVAAIARFKALITAFVLLISAADVGDDAVVRSSQSALERLTSA